MRRVLVLLALVVGVGGCGGQTTTTVTATASPTTTASATTPTAPVPRIPVLGAAGAFHGGEGFGSVKPSRVFLGGDPTGLFTDLHWTDWGNPMATASGEGRAPPPGKPVAESVPNRVRLTASNLGTCEGQRAYLRLTVTDLDPQPSAGSSWDACRGALEEPSTSDCSPGITVSGNVSCLLAGNVFYEYYKAVQGRRPTGTVPLTVRNPETGRPFSAFCRENAGVLACDVIDVGIRGVVEIAQSAIDAYTPEQARDYAATHNVGPNH